MFVLREKNEQGQIGVLDTTDNVVDYFPRNKIILFFEDLGIEYTNYDDLEKIVGLEEKEEKTSDYGNNLFDLPQEDDTVEMSSSDFGDDMFSSDSDFEAPTLTIPSDEFSSSEFDNDSDLGFEAPKLTEVPKVTQQDITPIPTIQPIMQSEQQLNQNNDAENLIKKVITTFQDNLIEVKINDCINQHTYGFIVSLYYINLSDKIILLNLHKYSEESECFGLPKYCVGYIDKNTEIFREMYNSDNPFFFTYRKDYIVLIKRDTKFTVNRLDLRIFKARIVGNPVKLKYATINFLCTDSENYYIVDIISRKKGTIGFLLLIDMTLKGDYYPYQVNNEEIQDWTNNNMFYREKLDDKTYNIVRSCNNIVIKDLSVTRNINLKFTTDIAESDKYLSILFEKTVANSSAKIEG